jgi:hypothetical protein
VPASCPSKPVLDQLADWARWGAELSADPERDHQHARRPGRSGAPELLRKTALGSGTVCTGCATALCTRTAPNCAPAPHPAPWPPYQPRDQRLSPRRTRQHRTRPPRPPQPRRRLQHLPNLTTRSASNRTLRNNAGALHTRSRLVFVGVRKRIEAKDLTTTCRAIRGNRTTQAL